MSKIDKARSNNSKYARKLRNNPTPAEDNFLSKIVGLDLGNVMFQKGFLAKGMHCIVDFYLPKYKLCIEIDGGYHNRPEQIKKTDRSANFNLLIFIFLLLID